MTAAILIGNTGEIHRFRNRDHFAAYTRTAPVEFSSGGRIVHRLSRRGNRTLNAAIYMAAVHRWTIRDGRAVAAHFSIDTPAMLRALTAG